VTDQVARLSRNYLPALLAYLPQQNEAGRRAAYELGREAMRDSIGLLELARVHHDACLGVMATAKDAATAVEIARASADFFLEVLAAFEMAQRAFMDIGLRRQGSVRSDSTP
jgi:hypothetical protein